MSPILVSDYNPVLAEEGANVKAYDPKALLPSTSRVPDSVKLVTDPLSCAQDVQALVLMTEWPEIVDADWEQIAGAMSLPRFIFDGRNALDPERMLDLGFRYCGVGRGTTTPVRTLIEVGD